MTFRVVQPTSLAEACALLADAPGTLPVAGGTDLLSEIRDGTAMPDVLVALDTTLMAGGWDEGGVNGARWLPADPECALEGGTPMRMIQAIAFLISRSHWCYACQASGHVRPRRTRGQQGPQEQRAPARGTRSADALRALRDSAPVSAAGISSRLKAVYTPGSERTSSVTGGASSPASPCSSSSTPTPTAPGR